MSIHDRGARCAAAIGGDLSADEIDALYQQLHRKGQRSIYISCKRAECSALANGFDQLFKRLGWPSSRSLDVTGSSAVSPIAREASYSGDPAIGPRPRGYNFKDLAFDLQDVAGTGGPWPGELASGAYDAAG
jgi:hypothetical protein